ncbi:hypothetical protein BDM02DRAFT_3113635 [Thelephora ganbajun]|uniref:Uncharacterized protein n=1 Tax=Thelephora ganbajun TaxID=370292 RepID=A0ACB6ZJ16_THEGA|nr:hypothetical protein BDM02DRAFT_3113635 [Thelephora ganbajun]
MPAEIGRLESNARSRGVLTHFRKPEMNTLKSHALQFLNAIDNLTNSLQPMNLLPPEMVSRIATHLIDEIEYYRPLLVATHVSRYWRETILGCSSLWTSIDSRHPNLAIICMERSNNAKLTVRLRPNVTLDFVSNLQLHTRRIKALDIRMPPSDFQKLLPQLDPHLIRLESMTLDLNSVYPLPCFSFPPLLSLDVSGLKELKVQNISLIPPFFHPTNLSKLSITSSDGWLSIFLDLIAANPHLEEIFITSRASDLKYPTRDVVSLPHLRVLDATLPWHAIKTLLRCVSLPPSAALIVTTTMEEYEQKEFLPALLPETLDPLQNLLRIETLTYHYSQVTNHQSLCGSSPPNVSQTQSHHSLNTGSFTFRWAAFTRFDLVFSPLSLSYVRHLQLNLDCVYSFRSTQVEQVARTACQYISIDGQDWYFEWRGVFRSLNRLERLTVVRLKDLTELVDLLTNHMEPPGSAPQLDVCPYRGRDLERRNSTVSTIRSAFPPPHRKSCRMDPPCPLLHTLEFIECHWLCSQFPVLLDFVRHRAPLTSPQDSPMLSPVPCPVSTLNPPIRVPSIRRIHIQSSRPSLLPRPQDIEALRGLVGTVIAEAGPQKDPSSQGVKSHYRLEVGGYERKPPLCAVCGTDLGVS